MAPSELAQTLAEFAEDRSSDSFERFYEASSPLVYTVCLRLLRSEEDAADAMQATYERVIREILGQPNPATAADAGGWIALTARREADALRKRRNRRANRENAMQQPSGESPREQIANNQLREMVQREVEALPDELRAPLELHLFHGMSQTELARMYETSQPTISRRIAHATRLLASRLSKAGVTEASLSAILVCGGSWICPPATLGAEVLSQVSKHIALGAPGPITHAAATGGGILGAAILKIKLVIFGSAIILLAALVVFHATRSASSGPSKPAHPVVSASPRPAETKNFGSGASGSRPGDTVGGEANAKSPIIHSAPATPGTSLHGTVRDRSTGAGVPNATVRLRENESISAVTNESGDFQLVGMAGLGGTKVSPFAFTSTMRPYQNSKSPVDLLSGTNNGPVELLVETGRALLGRATHADTGEPMAGVLVKVEDPLPGLTRSTETDEAGAFVLEGLRDGAFEASAAKKGFLEASVEILADSMDVRCDFAMRPTGIVHLRTIDDDGVAVPAVEIMGLGVRQVDMMYPMGTTDSRGELLIEGVPVKGASLIASREGYKNATERVTFPADDSATSTTIVLRRDPRNRGGWYAGVVTGPEGLPVADASVRWEQDFATVGRVWNETKTDSLGHYLFEVKPPAGDSMQLTVVSENHAIGSIAGRRLPLPGTRETPAIADFRLDAGHWLEIAVLDTAGNPLTVASMAMPSLPGVHGESNPMPGFTEDMRSKDGVITLRNLPGGSIGVRVRARNHTPVEMASVSVDQRIEVKLAGTVAMRGNVVDADTGDPIPAFKVLLSGGGLDIDYRDIGRTFNSPDGYFEIPGLTVEGRAWMRVEATGYIAFQDPAGRWTRTITDESVVVKLTRGREVRGITVDEQGKPLARVRLSSNRMVPNGRDPEEVDSTLSDAEGRFTLREPVEHLHITARSEGRGTLEIDPADRAERTSGQELVLVMEPAGTLRVAAPAESQFLLVRSTGAGWNPDTNANPLEGEWRQQIAGNSAEWTDLPPGNYLLVALPKAENAICVGVSTRIDAGDKESIDVGSYRGLLDVRVRLTDPTGSTAPENIWCYPRVWLRPDSQQSVLYMARASREDTVHFAGLPAGNYTAFVEHFRQGFGRTEYGRDRLAISGGGEYTLVWSPLAPADPGSP